MQKTCSHSHVTGLDVAIALGRETRVLVGLGVGVGDGIGQD
jgi:hypothetical protein